MIDSLRDALRLNIESIERLMILMGEGSVPLTSDKNQMREEKMSQFFRYDHLPPELQDISRPFCQLSEIIIQVLPSNPERTVALRKLLEAKDCAVRALIYK